MDNNDSPPKATSDLSASQREWLIERYLLDDPSLDREEFEARMAAEVELAWGVAEGVERLQRLAAVCCSSEPVPTVRRATPSTTKLRAHSWRRALPIQWVGLVAACGLLVWVASHWEFPPQPSQVPQASLNAIAGELPLSQVAETWLALKLPAVGDSRPSLTAPPEVDAEVNAPGGSLLEPEFPPLDGELHTSHNPAVAADENDWMSHIAPAYFEAEG